MNRPKILVVDDDPDITETICFALDQEGYQVMRATDGWEALGTVRATEPDLVILDVILPRENGYRISRFVKDDIEKGIYQKNIIILLLTARPLSDSDGSRMVMEFSHADHIMYKPFEIEQLIEKVKELLLCEKERKNGQ